jgi:hypothetical protein
LVVLAFAGPARFFASLLVGIDASSRKPSGTTTRRRECPFQSNKHHETQTPLGPPPKGWSG